ncbi:MAG: hypothetical protein WAL50_07460 [Kineosporiaceae bacterium]
MSTPTKDTPFMRFAATVADFGDPFYAEERERDVWNEASAFGFQVLLWGGYGLVGVMLWAGGAPVRPYALALLALVGLTAAMVIGYARRLGVEPIENAWRTRPRLVAIVALMAFVAAGFVWGGAGVGVGVDGLTLDRATIAGLLTGAGLALGLAAGLIWFTRRRDRSTAEDEQER